jgi:hypothetical protein
MFSKSTDNAKNLIHFNNFNNFNKYCYIKIINEPELLSINLSRSKILLCKINNLNIINLTYYSIITNLSLLYNFTHTFTNKLTNDYLMKIIIHYINKYNISFEIIIQLHDYSYIKFKCI